MISRKELFELIFGCFVYMLFSLSLIPSGNAATVTAQSASYSDVYNAITNASPGDVVFVPAGSGTWTNSLTITKPLIIIGAGALHTVITINLPSRSAGIEYVNTGFENFRLSGFKFITQGGAVAVRIRNMDSYAAPLGNVRVDQNIFYGLESTYAPFYIDGQIYGVADSNMWYVGSSSQQACVQFAGVQKASWANSIFSYGSAYNFYFEDNTFTLSNLGCVVIAGGQGGRYAARFNTITQNSTVNFAPVFDAHGNQDAGVYAAMGVEIYNNAISTNRANSVNMLGLRGGRGICFANAIAGTGIYTQNDVREEWADSRSAGVHGCADPYSLSLGNSCASDGETQHVCDSYFWNNLANSSYYMNTVKSSDYDGGPALPNNTPVLIENRDFWGGNFSMQTTPASPFDGTTGVGWGSKVNMPVNCTAGVGYWVIDEGEWNSNNGNSPDGRLYRCSGSNTWEPYYIPFGYPHHLRSLKDTVIEMPKNPSNLRVTQ